MTVENGKIVEATENELWEHWYNNELYNIIGFREYLQKMEYIGGAEIIRIGQIECVHCEDGKNGKCSRCARFELINVIEKLPLERIYEIIDEIRKEVAESEVTTNDP